MVGIRTQDLRKVYTSAPPFAAAGGFGPPAEGEIGPHNRGSQHQGTRTGLIRPGRGGVAVTRQVNTGTVCTTLDVCLLTSLFFGLPRMRETAWTMRFPAPGSVLVIGEQKGFSRTFGDGGPRWVACCWALFVPDPSRTRARNKANPARPYICRLIIFSRFTWPSTGPLLHSSVSAV